jgi:hypothetical protein
MRSPNHRGSAMLQLLLSTVLSLLVGAMLLLFIRIHMASRQLAMDQHSSELTAWRPTHRLTDNLRKAYPYGSGGATLAAGTANSVTVYDDSSGTTSRYWLDTTQTPPVLNRTRGTQTLELANGLNALSFTYYLATGQTVTQGACWATTANPHTPSVTEIPNVVAVGVTITTTVGGGTRTFTTAVRLRNGPRTVSGM